MKFKLQHRIIIALLVVLFIPSLVALSQAEQLPVPTPNAPNAIYYFFVPLIRMRSAATPTPPRSTPPPPTVTIPPNSTAMIIDHNSVALFERIPDRYLQDARSLRLLFSDRSVGQNIDEALDCLTAPTWGDSPAACRRDYYNTNWDWKTFMQDDLIAGLVPSRISFTPDAAKYNRSNWTFEFRTGTWSELTQDFIQSLAPSYLSSKDILSYQFSYLNVDQIDDISNPNTGFFANNADKYDIYDLEAFIHQHPDKLFIFWTTSLSRSIGTQVSENFNSQMRQYAIAHNKILFDIADIEAYDDYGNPCYDNRDNIQYCSQGGQCENHPADGFNVPAICQDYTTETDGGHLGSVSAAKIRIAKAFWVLMARAAGWNGVSS